MFEEKFVANCEDKKASPNQTRWAALNTFSIRND